MITPLQPITKERGDSLRMSRYEAVGNDRLQFDRDTRFPLIPVLNAYAEPGEELRVIALTPDTEAAHISRIEDVLVGDFSNHCLENEPGVALPAIRRSPIRAEHYLPLNGYSDEGRRVGRLKDAAAAGFLGLAKSSYSETRKKFRAFLWDELRKKHMTDENTERK